jgi:DNA mismatch repair protein MutS
MMEQYLSIKGKYQDAILFYRMGDFYEMFYEDAEIASRALEITLTSRNKTNQSPIPMCGVPVRAAQGYISRMIAQGFKVAICDQIEDPSKAKGLVKRDVVRVITPGMLFENELLDEKTNNFILAIGRLKQTYGLAYLDISTGAFRLTETKKLHSIVDETLRISPAEIIFPATFKNDSDIAPLVRAVSDKSISYLNDRVFDYKQARMLLLDQFQTLTLEGFGCENLKSGVAAAGASLFYVQETQKQHATHFSGIEVYALDQYLLIDDLSCRNLELQKNLRTGSVNGTLIGILDRTVTAMGARLLNRWLRYPLLKIKDIKARQDSVGEALKKAEKRQAIRESLKSVYDLERLAGRISMGHANARDLLSLKRSLCKLPEIIAYLKGFSSELFNWKDSVAPLSQLAELIDRGIREDAPLTLNEGGIIKPGFSQALDELILIGRDGKGALAKLEASEKEKTGISSLKVRYNKVFGYFIEIPKAHSKSVPLAYIRKQTLVNAERYITDELKTFETKVLGAEEKRFTLEYKLFQDIKKAVAAQTQLIQKTAKMVARIDCLFALADVADYNGYRRPEINQDGIIDLEDARHPVVEKLITGERFVPNSIRLDNEQQQILMITGPNMAGKSTVLRQVALTVIMSQIGSFIPAKKGNLCICDRIFTRVGALDNLSQGQSTFMVEMEETANILNNATSRSLIILDEIGRGTSTFDGMSIAWAVAEYLHDLRKKGVKTLFATHYHELTDLALTKVKIKNYNIAVKEWNDEIIFLRRLLEGGTNKSYGIQVARLAGIPEKVIQRAKEILTKIESGEHDFGAASDDEGKNQGPVQLSLFRKPEEIVLDMLRRIDISEMTPIQAINCLYELQEKVKVLK